MQPHEVYDTDKHRWLFIKSSRATGTNNQNHRYEINVCSDCGRFRIHGWFNNQFVDVGFELSTNDLIEAAGQYIKKLEESNAI